VQTQFMVLLDWVRASRLTCSSNFSCGQVGKQFRIWHKHNEELVLPTNYSYNEKLSRPTNTSSPLRQRVLVGRTGRFLVLPRPCFFPSDLFLLLSLISPSFYLLKNGGVLVSKVSKKKRRRESSGMPID
jgi:hypothetical protein